MKKVLFVSYDFPYPTNTGGKNRAYNLIKHAGKDLEMHLVSFVRDDYKKEYGKEIQKIGVKTIRLFKRRRLSDIGNIQSLFSRNSIFWFLYYDKEIEDVILKAIKELGIDIVHFESYYASFYIGEKIRDLKVKQIFGTENIEHFLYKDYAKHSSWLKRFFLSSQIKKIENEEIKLLKLSDKNIAVTEDEAKFIRRITRKECNVVPNGVDLDDFTYNSPSKKTNDLLLFIGNFTYFPNIDAINYFYYDVFKKLNKKIKLLVIGKNAEELGIAKDKRVEAISYILDIKEACSKADIMISPVRIGGGTNFKILEAMACGIPIIVHPGRVGSFGVRDGREMLLAETPVEFEQKIELLLEDFDLRNRLSKNARKLVEKDYSWKKIGEKLNFIWKNI